MHTSKPIDWITNCSGRFPRRPSANQGLKRGRRHPGVAISVGLLLIGLLVVVATGCSTTPRAQQTETLLVASNFKMVAATTPAQQAHLQAMTPGKFAIVKRNGKTYYVYPEAAHNRLYVGNQSQYLSYRQSYQDEQLSNGQVQGADLQEDAVFWDLWAETDFAN